MPLEASLLAYGMPTRALFLSKDEKALDALSQVLSDLDVSFELVQESSFALKRIAAHHFEMILVDCDNEQSATPIFASARNSSVNQATISVAVVEGKNGVANAFRLGASLVLSKPISMEQARGTLRNALAMVRKSSPEAAKSAPIAQASTPAISVPTAPLPAATTFSAPISKPAPAPPVKPAADSSHASMSAMPAPKIAEPRKSPIPAPTAMLTEGPRSGGEGSVPTKTPKAKSLGDNPALTSASRHPAPPTFGMPAEKDKSARKVSPFLLAAVAVALIAVGVYGYSMVNPGFRGLLTAQFANMGSKIGLAPKPHPVAQRPQPAAPQKSAEPAAQAAAPAPDVPAADAATSPPADGFAPSAQAAPAQGFTSSPAQQKSAPVILSTSATANEKPGTESEPLVVPEDVADSHVSYRVQPTYPESARKKGLKGSVVLNVSTDKDGNISGLEVVSGNALLANAAVAAVKQWRYQAYYHNGQPSEFQTQVTVHFPQPAQR